MNRSLFLGLVVGTWACAWGSPPARAAVVPDQSYFDAATTVYCTLSHADLGFERAQTITVGVTGMLHHVDVLLAPNSIGLSQMRILATSAGLPTSVVLGSSTAVSLLGDGWTHIDFSGSGLFVTAGEVLALEPIGIGTWQGRYGNGYPFGTGAYRGIAAVGLPDWAFDPEPLDVFLRTFVEVVPTGANSPSWGRIKRAYR